MFLLIREWREYLSLLNQNNKMKKLILLCFILLVGLYSYGQQTRLPKHVYGKPVPGATLTINDKGVPVWKAPAAKRYLALLNLTPNGNDTLIVREIINETGAEITITQSGSVLTITSSLPIFPETGGYRSVVPFYDSPNGGVRFIVVDQDGHPYQMTAYIFADTDGPLCSACADPVGWIPFEFYVYDRHATD